MTLVLNLSRIPQVGGLRAFANTILSQLEDSAFRIQVVAPSWLIAADTPFSAKVTPQYLASSSSISLLRPILWWIYSALFFPVARGIPTLALTHHVVPFRARQAVTVHDLRPLYAPDSPAQALYFRYMLPRSLRRCDGVITVSQTTKGLLQKEYGLPAEKIYVVSNCVDRTTFKPGPNLRFQENPDPFLLMVGASWSHKNAEEIIENASAWKEKYRLVIISANATHRQHLARLLEQAGLRHRVDLLPAQDKQRMVAYYQQCAALVYPSKMEGFGIPPLEAMACGRPVILSDIPVFRELYDEVPIYVKLGDKRSWSAALACLGDERFMARKIEQGIAKAAEFSEERTKSELLQAISSIWGQP